MTSPGFTEAMLEEVALAWLESLGWQAAHGTDFAPGAQAGERADWSDVVLADRLRDALERLNPTLPDSALDDAFRWLTAPQGSTLEARNREFHRMLAGGVTVEYRDEQERMRGAQAQVLDFADPRNNGLLAVNQLTVTERDHKRRPDIVLFVNGLPLAIIELKNPADEKATVWSAWNQLQTYKAELSGLFAMNELLIVSDGLDARIGTLTAGRGGSSPGGQSPESGSRIRICRPCKCYWRASAIPSGCSRCCAISSRMTTTAATRRRRS